MDHDGDDDGTHSKICENKMKKQSQFYHCVGRVLLFKYVYEMCMCVRVRTSTQKNNNSKKMNQNAQTSHLSHERTI